MVAEVDRLASSQVTVVGNWTLAQIFEHCAQSIGYSMTGYPQLRSKLFRVTVGRIAKGKFLGQGYMSHDLEAPVPGAPALGTDGDTAVAATKLRDAVAAFKAFTGEPAPHLAYGPCTLAEYERVHAMHFANHASRVSIG
jgi:Protein of unknown function (DUF1569)